jgi:hypothetical protein
MDEKQLLVAWLTKVYNKTEDEVKAIIYNAEGAVNEDAFDGLTTLDTARVARFNDEKKKYGVNQYARAKEEVLKAAESKFKEITGFSADAETFEDLVASFNADVSEKIKTKGKAPEDIKMHPDYIKLEKERIPKDQHEKLMQEYNEYKTKVDRERQFSTIKSKARQQLEALRPILPNNPQVKDNYLNIFLGAFEQYEYSDDGNGGVVIAKGGERLNDAHGNPVTLDSLTKQLAENYFEFQKQDPKAGAGNIQTQPGNPPAGDAVFKTKTEYNEMLKKAYEIQDPKERGQRLGSLIDKFKEVGKTLPD